jgi:putative flippase GtrA
MASLGTMLHDTRLRREAVRYATVGALGFALQLGSFALLVHVFGVPYVAAGIAAAALTLLNNFVLNRHWTFEVAHGRLSRQARRFLVISLFFAGLQVVILHLLVVIGVAKVLAEMISALAVVPPNFFTQRRLAFTAD